MTDLKTVRLKTSFGEVEITSTWGPKETMDLAKEAMVWLQNECKDPTPK